jgi:hypothetical protein
MADDEDLYLEPKRRLSRRRWLVLGLAAVLLALGGLALALQAKQLFQESTALVTPTMTLVPTFTPRPQATEAPPVVSLSARPWTGATAPVSMVEVTLVLPAGARVSHHPPAGYRYWCGDLLETRQGLAWSGSRGGEVRWHLFAGPGVTFPARLAVTVDGQELALELQPATPATVSAVLGE